MNSVLELRSLLDSTKGKVFKAEFVKKDGSVRLMQARIGVTSHLRGGENPVAHKPNIYTVFDMAIGEYRNIDLTRLRLVECGNISYRNYTTGLGLVRQ